MTLKKAKLLLNNIFGYDSFRPLQEDIIRHILSRKDTLVIMPTGGGKSLCYQLPALIFKGITLVVSPLISLMKDQVEQLRELGVNAVFLNSTLSREEYEYNLSCIKLGEIKLIYLAPEGLLTDRMAEFLSDIRVDCITIDEAHCISEWGHDFRPEYRKLIHVRKQFPEAVCVALTATATQRVRQDIKKCLEFGESDTFLASFNRSNLFLQVIPKRSPYYQIVDFLQARPDESGIIYCFSRKQVDELALDLDDAGFSVRPYHAGLDDNIRKKNQELFIKDDVRIMVATIAFGMGINKPNVRFVIHHDLPKNIESYYQQIGRAGRDGLNAHCLLLFSYGDTQKIKYFIKQMAPSEQKLAYQHLDALLRYAETGKCRRHPLLTYFGEKPLDSLCMMCDNCRTDDEDFVDLTRPAQMFISCVKRMDERFGIIHTIDVLRGSQSQKVLKFRHEKLSTHGIGTAWSKDEWIHFARQFIDQELLVQDRAVGSLHLTLKAWDVLNGKASVSGSRLPDETNYTGAGNTEPDHDLELLVQLKDKRKELADAANVPPYVIFSEKTLIQMAANYPQNETEMLSIFGIGNRKFKKHGAYFLHIIHKYCRENQIKRPSGNKPAPKSGLRPSDKRKRFYVIGEKYNQGLSLEYLSEEYNIKTSTVLNHLYDFLQSGGTIRKDNHFLTYCIATPDQQKEVLAYFDKHGTDMLRSVYLSMDEAVSYDDLHLLRVYYLSHKASG